MSLVLAGQIAGVAFACGLNLYATVAVLGILSRVGLIQGLPTGLQGLEGAVVIASALVLFVIEAVVDKIHHADSLWDAVHTFVRPPAAALLAIGALWGRPTLLVIAGAALALGVALAAHGSKAGLRLALNATMRTRAQTWISGAEDLLALAIAIGAFLVPIPTLAVVGAAVALSLLLGLRLWRAFYMGLRCLAAWLRSIFELSAWKEADQLPEHVRRLLGETPLGMAPPRGARAALHGLPEAGSFRNGWLVLAAQGPLFIFRTLTSVRSIELPPPEEVNAETGVWAHRLHVRSGPDTEYTVFMLKDGPGMELARQSLTHAVP